MLSLIPLLLVMTTAHHSALCLLHYHCRCCCYCFVIELFDAQLAPAAAVARLEAAAADDDSGVDSALMLACRKLVADRLQSDAPLQLPDAYSLDALLDGKTVEQVMMYYHSLHILLLLLTVVLRLPVK
jgi:hypothetical protein